MKQISKDYNLFVFYIFCAFFAFILNASLTYSVQDWSGIKPPNCKCHSKNQKMVEMHKPFGVKDCFVCHKPGTVKMEGEGKNSKMEMARKRKKEDKVCKGCHMIKENVTIPVTGKGE